MVKNVKNNLYFITDNSTVHETFIFSIFFIVNITRNMIVRVTILFSPCNIKRQRKKSLILILRNATDSIAFFYQCIHLRPREQIPVKVLVR